MDESESTTIYEALDAIAFSPDTGGGPAVLFHDTASQPPTRADVSFLELARLSLAAAHFLSSKCNVKQGDSVVIFLPSNIEWLALYLATTRLGAAAIVLNTRLRESEIRHVLKTSGARLVIVEQGFVGTDYIGIVSGAVDGTDFGQVTVVDTAKESNKKMAPSSTAGLNVLKFALPHGIELAGFDEMRNAPEMRQGKADDLSATFTTWVFH